MEQPYYKIIAKHTKHKDQVLDICQNDQFYKGKAHLWNYRDTALQQKFIFETQGEKGEKTAIKCEKSGNYLIKCVKSGKYLMVRSEQDEVNLRQQQNQNQEPQKFFIKQIQPEKNEFVIYTTYGKVLDCWRKCYKGGTDIIQWKYHGEDNQKWIINSDVYKYKNDKGKIIQEIHHHILAKYCGKAMDIHTESIIGHAITCKYWGGYNQQFYLQKQGNSGLTAIKCRKSNKYLTVKNNSKGSWVSIIEQDFKNLDSQKFKIQQTYPGSNENYIRTFCEKVLDVLKGSTRHGASVVQWDFNQTENQKWIIQPIGVEIQIKQKE